MGRDEERQPLSREFEEEVPELPPRDRIDAGSRFIEKQNRRLMHERASHGEPLSPAAGKQRGAPVEIRLEMGDRDQFVATLLQFFPAQTIKLAGKSKVLTHR